MPALESILQPEGWKRALEKYADATHLTIAVYDPSQKLLLGPVHSSPLFEIIGHGGQRLFATCAGRCLEQPAEPVIVDESTIAVIGSALVLEGETVGAVVAGYALTGFPNETVIRRFAQRSHLGFPPLWRAVRQQAPLTTGRLSVYAELLRVLTDTLMNENFKAGEYQRTASRLAEANRAKDQFVAMLSHELRNPLAPIQIAMHIIGRGERSDPSVRKARETVDHQVQHLVRLLDDLLEMSRITRGTIELQKQPVNVTTAVANALDASRSVIAHREHSLSVSFPETPVVIEADPVRLEQVVTNLVNNAAKYTPPKGHIAVSVAREADAAVIQVRDDGVGIARDLLPRVFDLFTQGDRSLAHSGGGLGVGLAIVQNLVALHGGSVTARSEGPGSGSEFVVRLPLGTTDKAERAFTEAAIEERRPPRPACILVVEDDVDSRDMLTALLELSGHRVRAAADGLQGVEVARSVHPDIAFIDVGLPGIDGYEVARRIRGHLGSKVLLVAVTGYGQAEDRRRSAEAGFEFHLVKPVSPNQIEQIIAGAAESNGPSERR